MRYLVGLLILCLVRLAVLSVGCGKDCGQAGCYDAVRVDLVPEIEGTYDVDLVLDGEAEAFTCVRDYDDPREVWTPQPPPLSYDIICDGKGFTRELGVNGIGHVPESLEITLSAEDGSWNGSLIASPTYKGTQPNGPDCPPTCRFARLTMTNDVGAFEVQP